MRAEELAHDAIREAESYRILSPYGKQRMAFGFVAAWMLLTSNPDDYATAMRALAIIARTYGLH